MTPHTPFDKAITIVMGSTNGIQGARHTKEGTRIGYWDIYMEFEQRGEMKVDYKQRLFLFPGLYHLLLGMQCFRVQFVFPFRIKGNFLFSLLQQICLQVLGSP
ncbi:hypothetical protein VNO78_20855 [Psophocarpus tetragonolobus]|uniref:Uncharacterized protein n=1 Tax=Psophocarpus tetragonolobus TaxID=3891 RepID=A0AAN9SB58_PSOTE